MSDPPLLARRVPVWALLVVLALLGAGFWVLREWRADVRARPDWRRATRLSQLERLPIGRDDVVFLGASLIEYGEWGDWLPDHPVRNFGVAGDTLADVLARVEPVLAARPRAVFVMVGLNDLSSGVPLATIEARQRELARLFAARAPETEVVFMSVLPVRREGPHGAKLNAAIDELNATLERVAAEEGAELLPLSKMFRDDRGQLRAEFTVDGTHLTGAGYELWSHLLADCGALSR